MGGDAALAGSCRLTTACIGADRGRLHALPRRAAGPITRPDGRALVPPGRYFRMHLVGYCRGTTQSAVWSGVAGFPVPASDAPWGGVSGCGPFLAVEDHGAPAPFAAFDWVRHGEAGLVNRAHRGGCRDHGGPSAAQHSCGATRVKATGRCSSTWPGRAARDATRPRPPRLDRKRKGRSFHEDLRATSWPTKMKDGSGTGLQTEHAGGSLHRRGGGAELHPAYEGDTTTASQNVGDGQGEPCER